MNMLEMLKKLFLRTNDSQFFRDSLSSERQAVLKHFEKHFGESCRMPQSNSAAEENPIDVYLIKPTGKHPYYTLFTIGMSSYPMSAPSGMDDYKYAELMLHLPLDWTIDNTSDNLWPVEWLKRVARYPQEHDTWLFYGRVIANGDDAAPIAFNTRFTSMTVSATRLLSDRDSFTMFELNKGKTVYCFTLLPLYQDEVAYRTEHSAEELFSLFESQSVSDVININRPSVLEMQQAESLLTQG
ncbi:MAG: suppressor of fused domain protein [Clostridiales bacterium]|jgi:hypothetical protein|nr:suppressor of fused domain protein [Clostridiales bacterium]